MFKALAFKMLPQMAKSPGKAAIGAKVNLGLLQGGGVVAIRKGNLSDLGARVVVPLLLLFSRRLSSTCHIFSPPAPAHKVPKHSDRNQCRLHLPEFPPPPPSPCQTVKNNLLSDAGVCASMKGVPQDWHSSLHLSGFLRADPPCSGVMRWQASETQQW